MMLDSEEYVINVHKSKKVIIKRDRKISITTKSENEKKLEEIIF